MKRTKRRFPSHGKAGRPPERFKHRTVLDIYALIQDLGGNKAVADMLGLHRTSPYNWVRLRSMPTHYLEVIKAERPEIVIDRYFVSSHDMMPRRSAAGE